MVRIDPCHGSDPGSIPGSFVIFLPGDSSQVHFFTSWANRVLGKEVEVLQAVV